MDSIPQIILIFLCVGLVAGTIRLVTWPLGPILWLMRRPPPPLEREK
jgi:hypothetical protein